LQVLGHRRSGGKAYQEGKTNFFHSQDKIFLQRYRFISEKPLPLHRKTQKEGIKTLRKHLLQ